jgi:hypothetical protein
MIASQQTLAGDARNGANLKRGVKQEAEGQKCQPAHQQEGLP